MSEQEISIPVSRSGSGVPPQKPNITPGPVAPIDTQKLSNDDVLNYIISKTPEDFLPWEKVTLPSKGLFYNNRIPGGVVEVRPMGIITDKILATSRLAQTGQSIERLYKQCVKLPDSSFDHMDLIQGDRNYLLWYLRGITHGNIYEFSITCTNDACKQTSIHEYDLNKLAETIQAAKHQREPFKVPLPHWTETLKKDVWVELRYLRGRDYETMRQSHQNKQRMVGGVARNAKGAPMVNAESFESLDSTVEENLNLAIVSINGNTDKIKISQALSRMSAQDTAVIREELRTEPGPDLTILVDCPHCNNEMKMGLPFTDSFFRPTKPSGVGS